MYVRAIGDGVGCTAVLKVRRFQPTLKRSACRTGPQIYGMQAMVAGRSQTLTEACFGNNNIAGILLSDMCVGLLSFNNRPWGRECVKAPRLFFFGWQAVGILADAHGLPRNTHEGRC